MWYKDDYIRRSLPVIENNYIRACHRALKLVDQSIRGLSALIRASNSSSKVKTLFTEKLSAERGGRRFD